VSLGTPPAEVEIDARLVEELIRAQHPDLAALELGAQPAASGWDNVMYRLGPDLAVRLPRRALGARCIDVEQRWLPRLAPALPVATPVPVRVGTPACGYPWPWSIVTWIPGTPASQMPLARDEAAAWGRFLRALHAIDTPDSPPENPYRGQSLSARDEAFRERLARLERAAALRIGDQAMLSNAWAAGLASLADEDTCWLHGDLHPRNVITSDGRLRGVIDWGDATVGDPSVDLCSAWLLFDPAEHGRIWQVYGRATPDRLVRARAWAAYFAVVLIDAGRVDDADFESLGRTIASRLSASA